MSPTDEPTFRIKEFDEERNDPWAQANRIGEAAANERRVSEEHRSEQAKLVDRRLFALRDEVELLHRSVGVTTKSIQKVDSAVAEMAEGMAENTKMTQQILSLMSSGKMIVAVIKFCGAMAIPISAVIALWHLLWPHGAGK